MQKLTILFSIVLGLSSMCASAQPTFHKIYIPDNPDNIARLREINRDIWQPFSEAYATNDAEKYIGLHAPDFIRANGGQWAGVRNLAEYGASVRKNFTRNTADYRKTTIDFTFFERAAGPETASERGIYRVTSTDKDSLPRYFYGQFHVFHRKVNGTWKIAVDYDSDEDGTINAQTFQAGWPTDVVRLADKRVTSLDTSTWYDHSRKRAIPIAIYNPKMEDKLKNQKIVIFSHGYGQNKGGDYLAYSYLTEFLASKGYFMVSIQHELPTDSLLPLTGTPQIVRRPFWERGADNILFVINELKKRNTALDFKHITLIGHSNGGDMTALFPQKYPDIVAKIITLDNRRMALPRTKYPAVYSLRSSDQPADEGVLPTVEEQKKLGMTIVKLPNTIHNHMDDHANDVQQQEICNYVLEFLNR